MSEPAGHGKELPVTAEAEAEGLDLQYVAAVKAAQREWAAGLMEAGVPAVLPLLSEAAAAAVVVVAAPSAAAVAAAEMITHPR